MRRRILCATCLAAAALVACGRKDSLYIDPGKLEPAKAPRSAPQRPPEKAPASSGSQPAA
jgi:hypothetical protein